MTLDEALLKLEAAESDAGEKTHYALDGTAPQWVKLLDAQDAVIRLQQARIDALEAALEEITLICFEYPTTMPDHTLYATMTSLAADQATHILARQIGLAIRGIKTAACGDARQQAEDAAAEADGEGKP